MNKESHHGINPGFAFNSIEKNSCEKKRNIQTVAFENGRLGMKLKVIFIFNNSYDSMW